MTLDIKKMKEQQENLKEALSGIRLWESQGYKQGKVVEGTSTLQIQCPDCPYLAASVETIFPFPDPKLITCRRCDMTYIGLE